MRLRMFPLLAAVATMAACASGGMGSSSGRSDLITAAQIESSGAQTAYDAVQRLEPQWLNSRGTGSMGAGGGSDTPDVYVGGNQVGGINYLQSVNATDVKEMQYFRPGEAATRFGMGHRGGVISVTLK